MFTLSLVYALCLSGLWYHVLCAQSHKVCFAGHLRHCLLELSVLVMSCVAMAVGELDFLLVYRL